MEFKKLLDISHNHLHHCNFLQNKVSKIRIMKFLNTLKVWVVLATFSCKLKSIVACIPATRSQYKGYETILHLIANGHPWFINPATSNTYIYMFKICPQRQNRCNLSQVPHVNSPEKKIKKYIWHTVESEKTITESRKSLKCKLTSVAPCPGLEIHQSEEWRG